MLGMASSSSFLVYICPSVCLFLIRFLSNIFKPAPLRYSRLKLALVEKHWYLFAYDALIEILSHENDRDDVHSSKPVKFPFFKVNSTRLVAPCGVKNVQNSSISGIPNETWGASLSSPKQ